MSDRRYGADAHNTDYERGREDERAAIVAWLRRVADHEVKDVNRYPEDAAYWCAAHIENGDHLGGDDE